MIKTARGGYRKGSGRKNQNKVRVSYRLAPDVAEYLKNHEKPATTITIIPIHTSPTAWSTPE